MTRVQLSASVDEAVLEAARAAVSEGRAEDVSEWVNAALLRQAEHDRLRSLGEFLADYEAEHGKITPDEIAEVKRSTRARAIVLRAESV